MKLTLHCLFLICCASGFHGLPATPELCVVSSLTTPYFTPLLDTPRKARGCSTLSTNPNAAFFARLDTSSNQSQTGSVNRRQRDVHVIFLHTIGRPSNLDPSPDLQTILLNIIVVPQRVNETKAQALNRMDLVLHSDRSVKWVVRASVDDEDENDDDFLTSQPNVLVSEGSRVEDNFNANVTHRRWSNRKALQRFVRHTFTGIASYSEVRGANHVELRIGAPSVGFVQCDMSASDVSAVVSASQMVQLETEGCFHEDYIGDNPMDVYVVELGGTKARNKRVGPNSLLPVMVQLLGEGTRPIPRNVTVVLKSHQPIRWQFGARRINGNIIVVSDRDDQVENSSADGTERLEVRSKTLPDNVVELLLSVTDEFGPPILYAKTPHASTLRLVVGSKNKHIPVTDLKRNGLEQAVLSDHSNPEKHRKLKLPTGSFPSAVFNTRFAAHEPKLDAVSQLKAAMTVHCGKTLINVTFPADLLEALGSPQLSLNDPSCKPTTNDTHVIVSSHITSCGNTGHNDGKFTLFSNYINVKFNRLDSDDEDMEASGDSMSEDGRIPVTCKHRPHFPGGNFPLPEVDIGYEPPDTHSQAQFYKMEMFREPSIKSHILFNTRPEAEMGETLYVRAFLESAAVQVVTEECWLSNMSNNRAAPALTLLRNMCPVEASTRIESTIQPQGAFSFRVDKSLLTLEVMYVHCRLGLCASDEQRAQGNAQMCANLTEHCSSANREAMQVSKFNAVTQFSHRGPFKLVARRHRELTSAQTEGYTVNNSARMPAPAPTLAPELVRTTTAGSVGKQLDHVGPPTDEDLPAGISTEIAVVIAIVSFAIGVGLTVTIWFIHNKTDPFRRRDKSAPAVATGAIASPNSGCSSTNSQAAIAT